jgi:uncharacterized protein
MAPARSRAALARHHDLIMKTKTLLLSLGSLAFAAHLFADAPAVHFRGVLDLGSSQMFSLATDGGVNTAWVSAGESFSGYRVVRFDKAAGELVLEQDGVESRLSLAAASGITTMVSDAEAALADASELLRSMKFEEMLSRAMDVQKEAMGDFMRQMSAQMGQKVDEEVIAMQMRVLEIFNEEMDWPSLHQDMAKAYGETFTREELRGLINFYSTPAGVAFIEKQPQLNMKVMQVMQPRMMQAMPKMQRAMQEIAAERTNRPSPSPAADPVAP